MATEEKKNTATLLDGQNSSHPEPFGLHEEDRPMLPGESQPPASDTATTHKTTGEKFYDGLQFSIGQASILVATAAIAYVARFGKDSYGPVPNVLKKFQGWMNDKLLHNKIYPLGEKGEFSTRLAGSLASTVVLFHGGNLFAPVMHYLENNREKIATYANKRWGKPGEVEVGHERLKDVPKQSWGDVIKGRVVAFLMVFASFTAIDTILGKDKSGAYLFDKYEEAFARKVTGLTKNGKVIAGIPITEKLTAELAGNSAYKFSKILALDLYATSAGIAIWSFISRLSAKNRSKSDHLACVEAISVPESGKTEIQLADNGEKETWQDKNKPAQKASFAGQEGSGSKDFTTRTMENSAVSTRIM